MRTSKSPQLRFATVLRTGVAASALLATSAFYPAMARAQEATDLQGAEDDAAPPPGSIIVTARKRDETLTDVPVSISAVSAEALDEAGIDDLTSLFAIIPGVENNADGSRIANKPAIRGVGSQENASIRQKVTTFIDGVPLIGAQGIGSFAGLQQVEVLRGPQSAAFGRSTFGGAINYVTRDPNDYFEASAEVGLATHDSYNFGATVSGPIIGEHLRVLVGGEHREYGGPEEWVNSDGEQLGYQRSDLGMVKVGIGATERLQVEIMYMRQEIEDGAPPILFANTSQLVPHPSNPSGACSASTPPNTGASCVILGAIDSDAIPRVFDYDFDNAVNPLENPGTRIRRDRIQGSISSEFDSGYSIDLVGGYSEEEGEGQLDRDSYTLPSNIHVVSTPDITERYGEFRFASPASDRFSWLVGASIYDYDYTNIVYANFSRGAIMDIFSEAATNIGFFFNTGFEATDRLSLSFEGRYQIDEISGVYPANAARGAPDDIIESSTTKSFLPRFSATYALNPDNNFYVQIARGNNPAGFNTNSLDPILQQTSASENFDLDGFRTYDEETMWSYEAGFKGLIGNGSLRYALSVYYIDVEGYVQPVTINWTPDDGVLLPGTNANDYFSRIFVNSGNFSGLGVEFEGSWQATDRLTLTTALGYNGAEFEDGSCSPIPLDYGVPAIQSSPFRCADVGGAQAPMVSRYTTHLSADYRFPISATVEGFARADHSWRSKRYSELTNTDYISGYHTVDLRAGIELDNFRIAAFVTNLLDDDTPSGAVRFFDGRLPGMTYNTSVQFRRPRQFGINLSYEY